MQFKAILFINLFLLFTFTILAQDSLYYQQINEVLIQSKKAVPSRLSDTESNQIYSGKKNEVLSLTNLNVNLTTNQTRQIFAGNLIPDKMDMIFQVIFLDILKHTTILLWKLLTKLN